MLTILRQEVVGDVQITEYTRDGVNVSHKVTQPVSVDVPEGEVLPNPPTIEQRLKEAEAKQSLMQQAIDDLILGGVL